MKQTKQSVEGTSFYHSVINATVNKLRRILGEPVYMNNNGDDKVNFEWEMEISKGDVFTVYDWKEYRSISEDETIEWHIGGMNKEVTELVKEEINEALTTLSRVAKNGYLIEYELDGKNCSALMYVKDLGELGLKMTKELIGVSENKIKEYKISLVLP